MGGSEDGRGWIMLIGPQQTPKQEPLTHHMEGHVLLCVHEHFNVYSGSVRRYQDCRDLVSAGYFMAKTRRVPNTAKRQD